MKSSELEAIAKSPKERADFVSSITKESSAKYRKDWNAYLETLKTAFAFDQSEGALLENHIENVRKFDDLNTLKAAFKCGNVSQDEVRTVLGFVRTPEAKRAVVKALMPQASLADLIRMRAITRHEAEEKLYEILKAKEDAQDSLSAGIVKSVKMDENAPDSPEAKKRIERKLREIAEDFDFDLVYVNTAELSENGLDKVLERSDIAKTIERKIAEGMAELRNILDVEKDLKPDAQGRLSVSFAKKIAEEFSGNEKPEHDIEGVELLVASASGRTSDPIVFEGVVKADGSAEASQKIRVRITGWTENASTGERKMDVAILDESGNVASIDSLTYDEFYRLAHRLENRSFQTSEAIGKKILVESAEFKRQIEEAKNATDDSSVNERLDAVIGPDIRSLEQLQEMFDELDSAGSAHGIKKGISITL